MLRQSLIWTCCLGICLTSQTSAQRESIFPPGVVNNVQHEIMSLAQSLSEALSAISQSSPLRTRSENLIGESMNSLKNTIKTWVKSYFKDPGDSGGPSHWVGKKNSGEPPGIPDGSGWGWVGQKIPPGPPKGSSGGKWWGWGTPKPDPPEDYDEGGSNKGSSGKWSTARPYVPEDWNEGEGSKEGWNGWKGWKGWEGWTPKPGAPGWGGGDGVGWGKWVYPHQPLHGAH